MIKQCSGICFIQHYLPELNAVDVKSVASDRANMRIVSQHE